MNNNNKTIIAFDVEEVNMLVEQILLCDGWDYSEIEDVEWSEEEIEKLYNHIVDGGYWSEFLHSEIRPIIKDVFSYKWEGKK